MRGLTLALALLSSSCVTTPRPKPESEFLLKLAPAAFGRELQLAQRITVVRGADRKTFEAQLEIDATGVRIAAVALGQTVASLSWNGSELTQQVSTHVPEAITAERILSDVQLAWWPAATIRAALPPGFALEELDGKRTLSRDGATVATVDYTGTGPVWNRVRLVHARYGYELDIESVELTP